MASVYKEQKLQQGGQQTAQQANPYSGLKGVNGNTANRLGQAQTGYAPSAAVQTANQYLQQVQQQKPGQYQSTYTDRLNSLFDQIQGRPSFQYDLNGDALWQNYKDQYMQGGKQAMLDTMGAAAGLTGGYGNSYAASVGNQAYQQYLRDMTGVIPELYDRAAARYDADTDQLMQNYALAQSADATDYSRWGDQLAQWNTDVDRAAGRYDTEYARDYGEYQDDLGYWTNMAGAENSQYMSNQQYANALALQMMNSGLMPSNSLLADAGIPAADARNVVLNARKKLQASSGSGKGKLGEADFEKMLNQYYTNLNKQAALSGANPGNSGNDYNALNKLGLLKK